MIMTPGTREPIDLQPCCSLLTNLRTDESVIVRRCTASWARLFFFLIGTLLLLVMIWTVSPNPSGEGQTSKGATVLDRTSCSPSCTGPCNDLRATAARI